MKLRSRLLLACVLTVAIPMLAWQGAEQLHASLLQARIDEQNLKVANMQRALNASSAVRQSLKVAAQKGAQEDWYAEESQYPIYIDGYDDDWQSLITPPLELPDQDSAKRPRLRLARHSGRLYLFLQVWDETVVYHQPPVPDPDRPEVHPSDATNRWVYGDAVELLVQRALSNEAGEPWKHVLFRSIAPGPLDALEASGTSGVSVDQSSPIAINPTSDWQGVWVQNEQGFQLELSLPLPAPGSVMGLAVVDIDSLGESRDRWAGNLDPQEMARIHRWRLPSHSVDASLLFHVDDRVQQRLLEWTEAGKRTRLFDAHGRLLADVNRLYERQSLDGAENDPGLNSGSLWHALLFRVFALFVADDLPLMPNYSGKPETLHLDAVRRHSLIDSDAQTSRYVSDENDRVLGTLARIGNDPVGNPVGNPVENPVGDSAGNPIGDPFSDPVSTAVEDSEFGYLLVESNEEHESAYADSEMVRLFSMLLLVSLLVGSGLLIYSLRLSKRSSAMR